VVKGVFDHISCFQNFSFRVGASCGASVFFADISVLLSPKAEAAGQTHHSAKNFLCMQCNEEQGAAETVK
jgi:hypothetical protein